MRAGDRVELLAEFETEGVRLAPGTPGYIVVDRWQGGEEALVCFVKEPPLAPAPVKRSSLHATGRSA